MATEASIAEAILTRFQSAGNVRIQKMFGEYALYLHDKVIAAIADNQLLVKITAPGQSFLGTDAPLGHPYPGAKSHFLIDWETKSPQWLAELALVTYEALPTPPPKKKKQ